MRTALSRSIRAELLEGDGVTAELAAWLELPNHTVRNGMWYLRKIGHVKQAGGAFRNKWLPSIYALTARGRTVARMERKEVAR